jgi:molybdate transport system substrate-binding protein
MNKHSYRTIAAGLAVVAGLALAGLASAAELKVMSSNGVKTVLEELVPQFEKSTGHKVVLQFAPAADIKAQIDKGAAFDIAVLTTALIDVLIKEGKAPAASRVNLANSGAGVAIKKGAPRPDLSSADAFKRALLNAKSIVYVGTGATGANMRKIFEQLGVAEEMKAKTKIVSGVSAADAVAHGDAELGFTQISEILPVAGAELAGPLPPELQIYTGFPAAVSASSKEPQAAKALLDFLRTPAAAAVIKAKGMEPGK